MTFRNLLSSVFVFMFLLSCSNDNSINPNNPVDSEKDYALVNIVGKSLVLYNSAMKYTLQAFDFSSNGTCDVVMIGGVYKLVGTPSYTYSKSTAKKASVKVIFTEQYKIGSDYIKLDETYTADLNFTSESGGTYTGTEKSVNKGNVGNPGTTNRNISGTFTLY